MSVEARTSAGRVSLEARDLVVVRDGRRVLDGACFSVAGGEVACIEGVSGSGKTTLLRALVDLTPIAGGTVRVDGIDAATLDPRALRRRIAWVPQEARMLEGTVEANVATGPRLAGRAIAGDRVAALLQHVGLDASFAERTARELSGGERHRVALARALANDPEALLLDEPTAALDPESAATILALVRTLASEGLAVVVVTHQREHARALGGTRWICEGGKLWRA